MKKHLLVSAILLVTLLLCACSSESKSEADNSNTDITAQDAVNNQIVMPPDEEQEGSTEQEIILDTTPVTAVVLQFNTLKEPFDNVALRRAVSFGLDRKQLCDKIDNASPMYGIIPDGIPHALNPSKTYRESVGEIFDDNAEFAKLLLSNYGYDISDFSQNGYSITAKKGDGVAQTIMFQLLEKTGLVLTVNYLEVEEYEKALKENNYDVILVDYPCAQDAKQYFSYLSGSAWENETYDELLLDLDTYSDTETYDKLNVYEMLEQVIFEDMAFAPLFSIGKAN